ncbi:hypothetical protein TNCV_1686141 [Trichonephila clavipes]|nr:hypothetical protein TNCV_1686141 [Trichonephila clavipes]
MPSIGGYHLYGLASILTGLESNRACVEGKGLAKMSSTGHHLSTDTFYDPMLPLAPEEIEAQGRADKQAFTGFNKMYNVFSLINSETRSKMTSSLSCP